MANIRERSNASKAIIVGALSVASLTANTAQAYMTPVTPRTHMMPLNSMRDQSRSSIRFQTAVFSATGEEIEDIETGSVFEDVDGIGTLTSNTQSPAINDLLGKDGNNPIDDIVDKAAEQLLNPSAVVEEIIGAALIDPEVNGMIPTKTLLHDAPPDGSTEILALREEEIIETPRVSKIIKFAIPAIGVWLCSPLLSLIDTSSVGLLSGTAQQAALNPAVAVTDYTALLVAFMYTATTNLVAGALESEKNVEDKPKTTRALISGLQLSGFVGLFLGSTLAILAPVLLKAIIGNDTIDPEVFGAALKYVRIRAIGLPAAVIIGSAQSACLGLQDIKSPMYVLVAAALVNLLGDILFVPRAHPLLGGAAGAAWATVFSQYAALGLFMKWMQSKTKPTTVNVTQAILELTSKSTEGKSRRMKFRKALRKMSFQAENKKNQESVNNTTKAESNPLKQIFKKRASRPDSFSTRGFLAGKFKKRQLLQFPSKEEALQFWPYVIPVTITSVGRVSAYVAMSHVVSSSLGTLSMAANQIVLSVFYCLCPFADSLNLTAQSFIPGIFQKRKGPARTKALNDTVKNFMKVGLAFGAVLTGIVGLVPLMGTYFTSDPNVIAQVNSVVPLLAGIFSVHGCICAGEGLLLGQKELGFLGKSYGFYFFAMPYFMLRLKGLALSGVKTVGLTSLWEVFMGYQLVRLFTWAVRLRYLGHKAARDELVPAPAGV